MISLKKRKNGFVAVLSGNVPLEEVRHFGFQLRDEAAGDPDPFVMVVDTRKFKSFHADAQAELEALLEEAHESLGLERISVLGVSTAFANLFCNMMVRTELMEIYQFLDLAYEEDWRTEMEQWLDLSETPV